jgi:hypothetical protein
MKSSLLFLLFSTFTLITVSCRDGSEPEPIVVVVDSSKIKPQIDINFTMLDSGYVQITNLTKKITKIEYNFSEDNTEKRFWQTREVNPKIFFYKNGIKEIEVRMGFDDGLRDTTFIKRVNVRNAPIIETPIFQSRIKGIYLKDTLDESIFTVNAFTGGGVAILPSGPPITNLFFNDGSLITIADFNDPQGLDFKIMVENLQPGLKLLRTTSNKFGWLVVFPNISNRIVLGDNFTDSLFIEEATVVYQPKIIPEMTDKAILVKMRIKGTFEGYGKVDLVFQHKYYHYKEYLIGF